MLHSLSHRRRQRIDDSDPTKFYERRLVVRGGSINPVTLSAPSNTQILRVWIPNSIICLNWHRPIDWSNFEEIYDPLKSIVFESNSHLTRIESNTFYESSLQSILIPNNVEIFCLRCFSRCKSLSSIIFESNSHLRRIGSNAFSNSSLQSILIPNSVEILGSGCFCDCKSLLSITWESNSLLTQIESEAFHKSSLESIVIPSTVQILGSFCVSYCKSLSSISFESNSRLIRIESSAFCSSSLESIVIPRNVQFIDGSAFADVSILLISIESGNEIQGVKKVPGPPSDFQISQT
jgi:hypothetical protein